MRHSKSAFSLLVLALVVGGLSASATGLLNTASGGYLVCVNTKSKVVTHPGTSSCPKGSTKLVLQVQGSAGINGLTGATGLAGDDGKDGRKGADGKTLWSGTTDPAITWGAPGDMFINSVTKTLFGPKDLTTGWPVGVSMAGPQGPQGLTGGRGPQGIAGSGPQGPAGATGSAGSAGATGSAGSAGATGSAGASTCATGGTCAIGDTGPGGGKVFIVKEPTAAAPWRYMEAPATNTWSGGVADPTIRWCSNQTEFAPNLRTGSRATLNTLTALGAGYTNTQIMLRGCAWGAANAAAAYNGGGKSDWHLPSSDELFQLQTQRIVVGGFAGGNYWSSSEKVDDNTRAHVVTMDNADRNFEPKNFQPSVRPVRAFG